jgi:hypothetical protein
MRKEQKNKNRKESVIVGEWTDKAVNLFEAAWDIIPEDSTLHVHPCEKLISCSFILIYSQMWYLNWFTAPLQL